MYMSPGTYGALHCCQAKIEESREHVSMQGRSVQLTVLIVIIIVFRSVCVHLHEPV